MRYHDDGTPDEEVFKRFCDFLFAIAVERSCWFVEKYYLRIFQKYLCYRETLFLTSAQTDTSFTYLCI